VEDSLLGGLKIDKGGEEMRDQIKWEKDLKPSIARARAENKQILLFFHNPN
jgi:hypothetical protein